MLLEKPLEFVDRGEKKLVKKLIFDNLNLSRFDVSKFDLKIEMVNNNGGIVISPDLEAGGYFICFKNIVEGEVKALGRKNDKSTFTATHTASAAKTATAESDDDAKIEIIPDTDNTHTLNSTSSSHSASLNKLSVKDELIRDCENNAGFVFTDLNIDKDLFKKTINNFSDEEITNTFYDNKKGWKPQFKVGKLRKWAEGNMANLTKNNSTTGTNTSETDTKTPPSKSSDLSSLKSQAISAINSALNQDPKLTDADLESTHQSWKTKLNNLNEESDIKLLKDNVIADINSKRKTKQDDKNITDNLQRAQALGATLEDKKNALNEIEKNEGKVSYEKNKEQTTNLKKEVAKNNPDDYRNKWCLEFQLN